MKHLIQILQKKELEKKAINSKTNNKQEIRIGSLLMIYFYEVAKGKLCKKVFAGVCLAKKNNLLNTSVTVKRIDKQAGVQMTFLLNAPIIIGYKAMLQQRLNRRRILKKFKNILNRQ